VTFPDNADADPRPNTRKAAKAPQPPSKPGGEYDLSATMASKAPGFFQSGGDRDLGGGKMTAHLDLASLRTPRGGIKYLAISPQRTQSKPGPRAAVGAQGDQRPPPAATQREYPNLGGCGRGLPRQIAGEALRGPIGGIMVMFETRH
jgi:hypothetical protein